MKKSEFSNFFESKLYFCLIGALTGLANGLFGSGGGMIAVPMLRKTEKDSKRCHASSLVLTLPLSVVSVFFYARSADFNLHDALMLVPFGGAGALTGCFLFKKVSGKTLRLIFGILMAIAGGRMLLG
jgi:hypothetical protein